MKKTLASLAICMLLSGCLKKQAETKKNVTNRNSESPTRVALADIYGENIPAFELEEETNPLSSTVHALNETPVIIEPEHKESLKTAYFDFDQYNIKDDQHSIMNYNLDNAKKLISKGKTLVIEGHACDSAGSEVYNMVLSEKRAETVRNYLASHGIPSKNIKTVGRGSEMLVVPAGTRDQQAPNRRVEIYAYDHIA